MYVYKLNTLKYLIFLLYFVLECYKYVINLVIGHTSSLCIIKIIPNISFVLCFEYYECVINLVIRHISSLCTVKILIDLQIQFIDFYKIRKTYFDNYMLFNQFYLSILN